MRGSAVVTHVFIWMYSYTAYTWQGVVGISKDLLQAECLMAGAFNNKSCLNFAECAGCLIMLGLGSTWHACSIYYNCHMYDGDQPETMYFTCERYGLLIRVVKKGFGSLTPAAAMADLSVATPSPQLLAMPCWPVPSMKNSTLGLTA